MTWVGEHGQVWSKSEQLGNAGAESAMKGVTKLGWKVNGCPLLYALFTHRLNNGPGCPPVC